VRLPSKKERISVYARHAVRLQAMLNRADVLDQRFFYMRAGLLTVGGTGAFFAIFLAPGRVGLIGMAALLLAFGVVVFFHRRVDRIRKRLQLSLEINISQLARMRLQWENIPAATQVPIAHDHPFAIDLSIVGAGSLHQLIDTATSQGGSQRLANWLLETTPNLDKIRARQALIQEVLPLVGFRRRISLEGLLAREKTQGLWSPERLLRWLDESEPPRSLIPILVVLFILAIANLALFVLNLVGFLPPFWSITLTLYAGIYLYKYRDYSHLMEDGYRVGQTLEQARGTYTYLEKYPYPGGSRLERLTEPFHKSGRRPSAFIRRIVWILTAVSLGENQFLTLIFNLVVPWNLFFAHLMTGYKKALHRSLAGWLDAWYELEAINSLANFAYLNPGNAFPTINFNIPEQGMSVFAARSLGHPLIPDELKISNDFSFAELGEVALVSGSNMSGKSTFLRTLGVNLCLAFTGSPVDASAMHTSAFRLFTCIQVSDSLSTGISYFYAEVRRLKALLEALQNDQSFPLFFLIDEIFRGTNNLERRIGSQAYVQTLANRLGVGVISTHDLELVKLADLNIHIHNYHFREDIQDGRMVFDYKLRRGPSPTTNALRIMEMAGLPINDEEIKE
jgi:ABC-type multidrug transport system fused ATPase/permease subunit